MLLLLKLAFDLVKPVRLDGLIHAVNREPPRHYSGSKWLHLKKLRFKARDFFSCIHFKSKVESNYAQFDARSDAFAHWHYRNLKLHWVAKVWLMLKQSFCHLKDQMHISCHLKPSLEKFLFLLTSVSAVQRKYKKIITKSLNFPIFQGANLRFMTMKPALPH